MRLDGYIRVSKVGGREGESFQSPQQQRDQIATWATARGFEIAAVHEDLDLSGGTLDRPGLQAVLNRVETGLTDGVVVAKLDRLGRSLLGVLTTVERVQAAGGVVVSVADGFDLSTTSGRLIMRVLASFAEFERERLAEGFRAAEANAIARGVHITNAAPFGYLRGDDGRLVPDPEAAPLVAEVFRMRAAGVSWRGLSDWLNARSTTTTGSRWTPRTVQSVIKRRTYLGEAFRVSRRRNGEVLREVRNKDAHEPIVTVPEFEAANAVRGGAGAVRRESPLLSGLIRCAGCGYSMKASKSKAHAGGEYRRAYSCRKRHAGGVCPAPASIACERLDSYLWGYFLTWYGDATAIEGDDTGEALAEARRQAEDARARLSAYLEDDDLRGTVDRDAYLAGARTRQVRVDAAEADLARLEAEQAADERRVTVLREDAEEWTVPEARFHLSGALDGIFVRAGRGAVVDRVVIFAKGDGPTDLPTRGVRGYTPRPLRWPDSPMLASVPRWAWRRGHPALDEDLRRAMNAAAAERAFVPLTREAPTPTQRAA
jgi:site-specific DNA recombinase